MIVPSGLARQHFPCSGPAAAGVYWRHCRPWILPPVRDNELSTRSLTKCFKCIHGVTLRSTHSSNSKLDLGAKCAYSPRSPAISYADPNYPIVNSAIMSILLITSYASSSSANIHLGYFHFLEPHGGVMEYVFSLFQNIGSSSPC